MKRPVTMGEGTMEEGYMAAATMVPLRCLVFCNCFGLNFQTSGS